MESKLGINKAVQGHDKCDSEGLRRKVCSTWPRTWRGANIRGALYRRALLPLSFGCASTAELNEPTLRQAGLALCTRTRRRSVGVAHEWHRMGTEQKGDTGQILHAQIDGCGNARMECGRLDYSEQSWRQAKRKQESEAILRRACASRSVVSGGRREIGRNGLHPGDEGASCGSAGQRCRVESARCRSACVIGPCE